MAKKKSLKTAAESNHDLPHDEDDLAPSKSQRKREMLELQKLGEQLLQLKASELDNITLSDPLLDALNVAKKIKSREGLRRQMQFIGKLMRSENIEDIQNYLQAKQEKHQFFTQQHHLVEEWRDKILAEPKQQIEIFLAQYPTADRQWLNQTVRQQQKELSLKKPPKAARQLFVYIREIILAD